MDGQTNVNKQSLASAGKENVYKILNNTEKYIPIKSRRAITMSDSSDEEDLSKFRDAVDTSFTTFLYKKVTTSHVQETPKPKSERYLEISSHYNDVKVPEKMQQQIGAKISAIINRNTEFVDLKQTVKLKKPKKVGGVKLFKDSDEYLKYEDNIDSYIDIYSLELKKVKKQHKVSAQNESNGADVGKSVAECSEATDTNELDIPKKLQKKIGAKLSDIISRNIEFIEVEPTSKTKKIKVKGMKLFKDSEGLHACEEVKDTYTEVHNNMSKNLERKRRIIDSMDHQLNEHDKMAAASISGDYVLSKKETKLWKSRRKEKIFRYKKSGKSKVLTALE